MQLIFLIKFRNLDRPDDYMQRGRNEIEVE